MQRYSIYIKRGSLVENKSPLGEWVRYEDVRSEIERLQSTDRALKLQIAGAILAARNPTYEGGMPHKAWMAGVSSDILHFVDTLVEVYAQREETQSPEEWEALRKKLVDSEMKIEEFTRTLRRIADWDEHPATLAVDRGSDGVRDYYRALAIYVISHPKDAKYICTQTEPVNNDP